MSGRLGIDDLEDLRPARPRNDAVEELVTEATEMTLIVNGADGWPRGVVVSFVRDGGSYWVTSVEGRGYLRSLRADPRVSLVVSNAGTSLPGRRMLALRGRATVHTDQRTRARMLPMIARRLAPQDPDAMVRLLDSPGRLLIEIVPVAVSASHDSRLIAGNGRGGDGHGDQPGTTTTTATEEAS